MKAKAIEAITGDLKREIRALEAENAVLREAAELLAKVVLEDEPEELRIDVVEAAKSIRRTIATLANAPSGKVLVDRELLRETLGAISLACGNVEHGSESYIELACQREWLDALLKED